MRRAYRASPRPCWTWRGDGGGPGPEPQRPNLGHGVPNSGMVAAAVEARFLGCPAMAVSLADRADGRYPGAATAALSLARQLREQPLQVDLSRDAALGRLSKWREGGE